MNEKEKGKLDKTKFRLKRREYLDKTRLDLSITLDKYLLSFSTASIYLSLFFRKDLQTDLTYSWLLTVSWSLLLLCIVATLLSFAVSSKAHSRQIEIVDDLIEKEESNKYNGWVIPLAHINVASMLFFVAGIISISMFFLQNLK